MGFLVASAIAFRIISSRGTQTKSNRLFGYPSSAVAALGKLGSPSTALSSNGEVSHVREADIRLPLARPGLVLVPFLRAELCGITFSRDLALWRIHALQKAMSTSAEMPMAKVMTAQKSVPTVWPETDWIRIRSRKKIPKYTTPSSTMRQRADAIETFNRRRSLRMSPDLEGVWTDFKASVQWP